MLAISIVWEVFGFQVYIVSVNTLTPSVLLIKILKKVDQVDAFVYNHLSLHYDRMLVNINYEGNTNNTSITEK